MEVHHIRKDYKPPKKQGKQKKFKYKSNTLRIIAISVVLMIVGAIWLNSAIDRGAEASRHQYASRFINALDYNLHRTLPPGAYTIVNKAFQPFLNPEKMIKRMQNVAAGGDPNAPIANNDDIASQYGRPKSGFEKFLDSWLMIATIVGGTGAVVMRVMLNLFVY